MRIWLITVGEPLPSDDGNNRYLRTGVLAQHLVDAGHQVTWWSSTFDHARKRHRETTDKKISMGSNFDIWLLHAAGYRKNISFARLINHGGTARKFRKYSWEERSPDILLSSFPTVELCAEAVVYGKKYNVPVLIDIRDLWPDIFLDFCPAFAKPFMKKGLLPYERKTDFALRNCNGILGISEKYLNWGLNRAGRQQGENDAVFPLGYKKPAATRKRIDLAEGSLTSSGVDKNKVICWFVGSFGRTYDLATVIQSARQLEAGGHDEVQFVLSGDGDRFQEWKSLADGLSNVIFTGWIDAEQIAFLSGIADIGLQAYADRAPQGLANKLFEYMSSGLAILSSLDGENAKLIEAQECGMTYPAGDSAVLSDQIVKLVKNRDLMKRYQENAARLFQQNFQAEQVSQKITRHLEEVCQNHACQKYE